MRHGIGRIAIGMGIYCSHGIYLYINNHAPLQRDSVSRDVIYTAAIMAVTHR